MYPQSMFLIGKKKKKDQLKIVIFIIFTAIKIHSILHRRVIVMTGAKYRKVPKFWDARKICCNLPKIRTKSPNIGVFCLKDAIEIANSEGPDQTAPLGAV